MSIEWLRPSLKGVNSSFLTSVLFATGRFPLSQRLTLVGDLPFAYFNGDIERFRNIPGLQTSRSSTTIGNPYVGMEIQKKRLRFLLS